MSSPLLFRFAVLMDKFHYTPDQIGDMTDAQIDALCFWKRDKNGALVEPETDATPQAAQPEPTAVDRLGTIMRLESLKLITPQQAQALRDEVTRGQDTGG